ncbi:MAG TPA: endonuclease [Candidatus Ozemobacteraceae bacterium]|nr:endonuclease [Candidatus Ozemobacteraceae bacterium]
MRITGITRAFLGIIGAALLIVPPAVQAQPQAQTPSQTPNQGFQRPAESGGGEDQGYDRNDEFKQIIGIIDLIEDRYPDTRDLTVKLRGRLYRHERNHVKSRSSADRAGFAADVETSGRVTRRPRPGVGEALEVPPGADMYTPCMGLRDKALIQQLREVSAYQMGVDYTTARKMMFTKIDNFGGEVECVYTGRKGRYTDIPSDRDMNCEHTWPQSLGATGVAKSDLHHLFPTDSKANSIRGSLPFGNVNEANWEEGGSRCNGSVFEPRTEHRGNVARAKFYFAVRYGKTIGNAEEAALREWHKEDPVDAAERERCNKIENIQHNRNPFIDHPEFVDQISDF